MANCQEAKVKLANAKLNKLKSAAKNKTGTILSSNKKNLEDEELPLEFILNEDMNDIIKIIKSIIKDSGVLIDGVNWLKLC